MSKRPTQPDDWSGPSEALFHAARGAHAPTTADRERVRSELAQKLAAASGAPATGGAAQARFAGSGMSRAAIGKLAKVGFGVACALVGVAAFMRAADSHERTAATSRAVQASPAIAQPAQRAAEPEIAGIAAGDAAATTGVVATAPATGARAQDTVPARAVRRSGTPSAPAKVSVPVPAPEHPHPGAVDRASGDIAPAVRGGATHGIAPVLRGGATAGTRSPPSQPDFAAQGVEDTADARAELEFVARINAAVRESTPQTVLALCAEHERRWPHGIFEQEREGTRAIAWCNAKSTVAAARARGFLASHPRTAIAARVREECAPLLTADAREREDPGRSAH